jgi:hypothetical protein
VIAALRESAAEGRLDLDEFGERLDEAYQAATVEQLRRALRELPAAASALAPVAEPPPPPRPPGRVAPAPRPVPRVTRHPAPGTVAKAMWGAHLGAYVSVNIMLIVIWLLSDARYFWPMWPLMGWGVGLASHGMAHAAAQRARRSQLGR